MFTREFVLPPEHIYPPDEWRLVEARYADDYVDRAETVFSLSNGFLGVRGSFEEGRPPQPRLATVLPERVLKPRASELAGGRILLGYQTTNSRMTLGVGVDHVIDAACPHQVVGSVDDDTGELVLTADAPPGVPIRITKYATYQASRSIPVLELVDRCRRTLDRMIRDGFDALAAKQREHLDRFWDRADVRVESRTNPVRIQQAIRWNLFQLAQASWRAEGTGIPAKGLTGQAYEGHYFWDTEIYVLPFLSYTQPRIARNLLRFRHSMLDRARERAREVSQRARCSRGGPSTARRPRPTSRRAPRSITSTRTSPTRSGATPTSAATCGCSLRSAPRSWSRPPACGRTLGSTAPTGGSISTA